MRKAVNRAKSKGIKLNGMIHHSDGGKQYESGIYKNLCNRHGILQSMCMYSFENSSAEKTNDLINNGYLNYWKLRILEELRACQRKAVIDHNGKRKKAILNGLSPFEFKTKLKSVPIIAHTLMLKPCNPEKPRKRIVKQSLNLTVEKIRT
jgi:putative transposase